MSSMLSSQGVALATAMAAVSAGTIILLAFRLQKSIPTPNHFSSVNLISTDSQRLLRSCISSEGKRKEEKRKKKKVQFAEDVVDPTGNSEEYRRKLRTQQQQLYSSSTSQKEKEKEEEVVVDDDSVFRKKRVVVGREEGKGKMPANRAALYNGILRDRVLHRVAFSF